MSEEEEGGSEGGRTGRAEGRAARKQSLVLSGDTNWGKAMFDGVEVTESGVGVLSEEGVEHCHSVCVGG